MRNGPNTNAIYNLPLNSPVLVWREGNIGQSGHWDKPFTLLTVEGKTCTIKLFSGLTAFRSIVVKPYFQATKSQEQIIRLESPPKPLFRLVFLEIVLKRLIKA